MSALLLNVTSVLQELWRGRWVAVAVTWVLALIFAVAILFVQDRYEASARIYIDTQSVLKPLMKDLAFQPDVDQQVRMLAKTLISRPNVELLRASSEIGWEPTSPKRYAREVDELINKIKVAPSGAKNIYAISYRDTDSDRARRLVEALVKTFVTSSNADSLKGSEDARRFIDEQIASHEEKLAEAENARKEFKIKNFGVSGIPTQDFFVRMSVLSEEVNKLRLEVSAAEHARDALKRELATEDPQLPPDAISSTPVLQTETESRLEVLKKQLDELLRRYTDEHPDVVSTRRTINQLESQRRQELQARVPASGAAGRGIAATNPVYQKIRFALAEAEANLAALRVRLSGLLARQEQGRAMGTRAPIVEAEWSQLERDYDVIRKNYELLVARRESASMGVKLDESSPLVEFRIIDPPRAEPRPVFPSRVILALLGALLAIGGGLAAAFSFSRLHPVVRNADLLRLVSGRPVLGSVSLNADALSNRKERRNLIAFGTAVAAFVVVQGAWIGWALRYSLV